MMLNNRVLSLCTGSKQDGLGCQPAPDTGREITQGIQRKGAVCYHFPAIAVLNDFHIQYNLVDVNYVE